VLIDGQPIGRGYIVRLLGIEPPLLSDPWNQVAVEWLTDEIELKVVVLESDEEGDERDAQNNLLRYVWKEGQMVNVQMVQLGLATASEDMSALGYSDDLLSAQAEAQAAERGLWGPPPTLTPTPLITVTTTISGTQAPTVTLTTTLTATFSLTQTPATTITPSPTP
jgi:endonuclease YncB( thermonuclease family)